jgi:hypothetical protein
MCFTDSFFLPVNGAWQKSWFVDVPNYVAFFFFSVVNQRKQVWKYTIHEAVVFVFALLSFLSWNKLHYCHFFCRRRPRRSRAGVLRSSSSPLRVCLHRVASPLHWPTMAPLAWLHRHPRYNLSFRIIVVYRVTQLGASHSKEIWLKIYRSLHIYNCICFELSIFLDSPRMRRWD